MNPLCTVIMRKRLGNCYEATATKCKGVAISGKGVESLLGWLEDAGLGKPDTEEDTLLGPPMPSSLLASFPVLENGPVTSLRIYQ